MVLAKLIHAADIKSSDRVLDVGCATGYAAAVLARMASQVVALDQDSGLVQAARSALAGQSNVTLASGPLAAGWPQAAPYDVVLFEGATEVAPQAFLSQLEGWGPAGLPLGAPPPPFAEPPFWAFDGGGGAGGGISLRRTVCCPTVHRFVVIQYSINPTGNRITKITKMNGSARNM